MAIGVGGRWVSTPCGLGAVRYANTGRPRCYDMAKEQTLQIRLSDVEKKGLLDAAGLAGIPLSSSVRERLRLAATRELDSAGIRIPFVNPGHLRGSDGGK